MEPRTIKILLWVMAGVVLLLVGVISAKATDCPKDAKTCKVLVLTPEEEQAVTALIANTGIQGPYNQVKGAVDFWLKRIAEAPAGEIAKPEKK